MTTDTIHDVRALRNSAEREICEILSTLSKRVGCGMRITIDTTTAEQIGSTIRFTYEVDIELTL